MSTFYNSIVGVADDRPIKTIGKHRRGTRENKHRRASPKVEILFPSLSRSERVYKCAEKGREAYNYTLSILYIPCSRFTRRETIST